jgi:hypothetical protein
LIRQPHRKTNISFSSGYFFPLFNNIFETFSHAYISKDVPQKSQCNACLLRLLGIYTIKRGKS